MPQVTSTVFGLIIAYFLPGLVVLFSLTFWSESVADLFRTFLTLESNVGLFLLVLLAALVLGLVIQSVRWLCFERGRTRLKAEDFAELGKAGNLQAYTSAIDENFRHHQFLGGLSIALPLLMAGWLKSNWGEFTWLARCGVILGATVLEGIIIAAAVEAYSKFYQRAKRILGREPDDERSS